MNWTYLREKYLRDHFIILAFAMVALFIGGNTHYRVALLAGFFLLLAGLAVWFLSDLEKYNQRENERGPERPGG